jgi:hypothetical protein
MYAHITWGQLKTALSERLHDPLKVHWVDAELDLYLRESLRTFGSLSAFWKERASFYTIANQAWYDLPTMVPLQLGLTLTDRDIISQVLYHIMEPPVTDWSTWPGTEQFTLNDLQKSLQQRRDQFLTETGLLATQTTLPFVYPAHIGRVALNDNMIAIRRISWIDPDGYHHILWRDDDYSWQTYNQYSTVDQGVPLSYSVLSTQPLEVQLYPNPNTSGFLDIITVNTGSPLTTATSASILGIPDDLCWILKWGLLADILGKNGPATDPYRAKFCEQRYQQGIEIATQMALLHGGIKWEINGNGVLPMPISTLDAYDRKWQDKIGTPKSCALENFNLFALSPVPSTNKTSVSVDIARKSPMPDSDIDYLQIGREQIDALLDYAHHLASFKEGGEEFSMTERQSDNFLLQALNFNQMLKTAVRFIKPVEDQHKEEVFRTPFRRKNGRV